MVLAFRPAATATPTTDEQADRAAWVALEALGALTRLANAATTQHEAYRIHAQANHVISVALGVVGVALDRAARMADGATA